jgi:hypothetical protein
MPRLQLAHRYNQCFPAVAYAVLGKEKLREPSPNPLRLALRSGEKRTKPIKIMAVRILPH